jgi:hypothetical protein
MVLARERGHKLVFCNFNAQPHNSSNKDYFAPFKTCGTLGESVKMKIGLFLQISSIKHKILRRKNNTLKSIQLQNQFTISIQL